jgi:3-oxoacyl-[acyl-carrier-protein] synthase-3
LQIKSRAVSTGIKERRIVTNESTCDLALIAANNALKMSGINATELDFLILRTLVLQFSQ